MAASGWIVYVLLLVLLLMFWRKARGRSLDDLIAHGAADHHHVHRVLAKHPRGATWKNHQRRMSEEA